MGEGDLLEGLEANTRVFVQIVFIFVMEGGVKTQTGSTHLSPWEGMEGFVPIPLS